MNILITGSRGFIGSATTTALTRSGLQWTPFLGNILNPQDFEPYAHCDTILHLAGITRTDSTPEAQSKLVEVNVNGTLNALKFAGANNRRFIFASTCSYGSPDVCPFPESLPITYHEPYSFSKWASEQLISAWCQFFNTNGTILRIFNVYGPSQPTRFLIPDIIEMLKKKSISLKNLTAIRDFIYVDDLAELITRIIQAQVNGLHIVNAGSGTGSSVGQVLEEIQKLAGTNLPVKDKGLPELVPTSIADIQKATNDFGWLPGTSLHEGLRAVLAHNDLLNITDHA